MIKIEQAQEVAKRLRSLMGSWPLPQEAAGAVDALIAELNDERMRSAQADNAVAQMAAELATLKAQKPVAWALPEITQQHNGQIVKHTAFHGYSVQLYLAAGAQPYDQQALEPCEACGWKAIIPGEQCLVCERNEMPAAGARIIPAGYQLVRIEPTDQMLEMGSIATDYDYSQERIKRVWQQMLMAAAREQVSQQFGNESHFTTRQERKPKCVARIEVFGKDWRLDYLSLPVGKHDLYAQEYTHDAQERKPLTDEQIYSITGVADRDEMMHRMARNIARAIEQAHGIKGQP